MPYLVDGKSQHSEPVYPISYVDRVMFKNNHILVKYVPKSIVFMYIIFITIYKKDVFLKIHEITVLLANFGQQYKMTNDTQRSVSSALHDLPLITVN